MFVLWIPESCTYLEVLSQFKSGKLHAETYAVISH